MTTMRFGKLKQKLIQTMVHYEFDLVHIVKMTDTTRESKSTEAKMKKMIESTNKLLKKDGQ